MASSYLPTFEDCKAQVWQLGACQHLCTGLRIAQIVIFSLLLIAFGFVIGLAISRVSFGSECKRILDLGEPEKSRQAGKLLVGCEKYDCSGYRRKRSVR